VTSTPAFPRSVCVRLTRRCNAACAFCQAPDTDRHVITLQELRHLCSWLRRREVRSVKLSGGEPTVRRDLPAVIGAAAASGLKVTVITNGIVLRQEVLEALVSSDGELKFSVHGLAEEHDLAVGRTSFHQLVDNVRRARRAHVPCSINTVVTRANRHRMRQLVQWAVDQDCRKVSFIPFVPRGRGLMVRSTMELSPEACRDVAAQILDLAYEFEGLVTVRQIDLRVKPYWIVENDLSLVIESWIEDQDQIVLSSRDLRKLIFPGQDRDALGVEGGVPS
jgi:MoaA/NifB/PqqE/SkfB family radical SAM enzyme